MPTTFSIDQLRVGMFVESLVDGKRLSVRAAGLITSPQAIEKLRNAGVSRVKVDLSRSQLPEEPPREEAAEPPEPFNPKAEQPTSFDQEIVKAEALFGEAKHFARQALDKAKHGEAIELDEAQQHSEQLIGSVFRNQSALLCMTRLRTKDDYLLEHSVSVATLMTILAKALELPADTIRLLAMGALLHDVGKILTPDEVLHKPGRLTDEEFTIMKQHVVHSYHILRRSKGIPPLALEVAANHHERPDGKGYPRGLQGKQLSRYARMINIADCYDAMTADRVYRKGMEPTRALKILLENTPHQFDPELVATFIRCIGVYPVGSMVKLKSERVGVVVDEGATSLTPQVKLFYHARHRHYIPVELVKMDEMRNQDPIASSILPEQYGLDLAEVL